MTLWNPRSIFSNSDKSDGIDPASSFDPSRTGDPLPRTEPPTIGFGSTSTDRSTEGGSQRRPIGFAPPEDRPDPRFTTELSFKRHHDAPRASAAPEPPSADPSPWTTPAVDDATPVAGRAEPADADPEKVERVSFLKREISFGRKRQSSPDEAVAEASAVAEPVEADEVTAVETSEEEPVAEEHDADEAPEVEKAVPFYKRELSFGRKRDAASVEEDAAIVEEPVGEASVVEEPVLSDAEEPVAEEHDTDEAPEVEKVVPFYKRELSFGRKRDAASVEEPVVADAAEPVAEEHDTDEAPDVEKVVPFYRREINLGRKKQAPVEASSEPEPETEPATEAVAVDAEPDADVQVATVEVLAASEPEPEADVAEEAPLDEPEVATTDETPAAESVPFYRRELSLRRKASVAAEAGESLADTEVEPDAASVTPESEREPVVAEVVVAGAVAAALDAAVDRDEPAEETSEPADEAVDASEPVVAVSPEDDSEQSDAPEHPEHPESVGGRDDSPAAEAEHQDEIAADASEELLPAAETPDELPAAETDVVEAEPTDEPAAEAEADAGAADEGAADAAPSRFSRRKGERKKKDRSRPSRGQKGRRVVGLKIGASQIAAAVINETEAGHELVQVARRSLEPGIVVDGEVRDAAALSAALASFFEDEKLPRKDVRIGVSSNRIGVRTFDIAGVADEKQFDNAVRFKAHELLPVAVHESVLDYRVLEERPNEDGELMRRVLLVVAPRDQVEPYVHVAGKAGLSLAGIDLEALALLRAFVSPTPVSAGAVADTATVVVAIGHETSTLLVAAGGACEFTRVFDWGGGELVDSIAASLEIDRAEARTILEHLSLSGPGLKLDSLDDESRTRAVEAVRMRLTPFARELVNSLQFYQTQADSLGIGGIVVTGGTSHLEGLDASLNQMIGVSVQVGDPFARVSLAADFDPTIDGVTGSLAVPIGLAINDISMRGVNLIPGDVQAAKRTTKATALSFAAPAAAAIPLVALGVLYFGAHSSASTTQARLDEVAAEVATLPKPAKPVIQADVAADEAARATALASVLGGRIAWDSVFNDLARVLPENVWLQTLSVTEPVAAGAPGAAAAAAGAAAPAALGQPAAAPTAVNLDGFTYDQAGVARLLARLATLPSLDRVTLVSSEAALVGSKNATHFVIVADLKNAGGAS